MNRWRILLYTYCFFFISLSSAQCPEDLGGVIWKGNSPLLSFEELSLHAAPMLWFSPDEIELYDKEGKKRLPNNFPFEENGGPVVYYKIKTLYAKEEEGAMQASSNTPPNLKLIDLQKVKAIDLDYYYYFDKETGARGHQHDLEGVLLNIQIIETLDCPDYRYAVMIKKATGKAHGLHWYNNVLDVDAQTFFPLSILIEEGKHASSTDKNADGIFTPGYDVTKRVNDAWGVRDIITTGRLVSGSFQAWMTKRRTPESLLFPPLPKSSPYYEKFSAKFGSLIDSSVYTLRPYPVYPIEAIKEDKKLNRLLKGRKPNVWPNVKKVEGNGSIRQWAKTENAFNSIGLAYRWDDSRGLSVALPLLLFKNVEAPLTGGWLYHKISFGRFDTNITDSTFVFQKLLGHEIVYTSSASKWIDTYVGLGYEVYDEDSRPNFRKAKVEMVSEVGIKIRLNISSTPLKFLRFLGTDFWGLRLGWKNVGFSPFIYNGFVIELGAGVF